MINELDCEAVRLGVWQFLIGKEPGTYTADDGSMVLTWSKTDTGYRAAYKLHYLTWHFDYLCEEIEVGRSAMLKN